ncbi:hypothetical protein [Saccharothrix variisporea]|uniref:Uncharacterized protein n=1 Tax=Saccharothrix variisporea TaxID=543527 RepID=A0A495XCA8_9PSEU|nr:hypothetical protein [Saccharothrix variisporea]RKT70474.1 hypothetical protein DFJ66_3740 [Saccharothrix variisporea]
MDDEIHHHHRKKNNRAALKVGLVVLGVLVLLGVIQAATAGTVGIGALSVTLSSSSPTTTTRTATSLDGVVGETTTTEDTPTTTAETKVATGSWKVARGLLTVEVTRVENAGGRLRLHVTAINASTAKMDLPLASISAVDDTKRNYSASLSTSKWPVTIAKNASTSGYVELDQRAAGQATTLTLTFSGINGQLAPTGGEVAVTGIPVPR